MPQLDGPLQLEVAHQLEGPLSTLSLLAVPLQIDVMLRLDVSLQQLHVPLRHDILWPLDASLQLDETLQLQAILKLQVPPMLFLGKSRRVAIRMHSLDPAEVRQNAPGNAIIQVK